MPHVVNSIFEAFVFGFGAAAGWSLFNGIIGLFSKNKAP